MRVIRNIAVAGMSSLLLAASFAPANGQAQTIARRVQSVRDGKVRMSFASRPDVCGWVDGINTGASRHNVGSFSTTSRSEDVVYDQNCNDGPERVVLTVHDGSVEKIRTYVGGRWRPLASGDVDLGTVPVREAVDYLFSLANGGDKDAVFPTTIADSVDVTGRLYDLARNESRDTDVRDQAVFWLSQQDDDSAVGMLETLLKTSRNTSIQEKAIFGLSQHHSGKGFGVLRTYAENPNAPVDLRGKAIFWLGQRQGNNEAYLGELYNRLNSEDLKDKVIFAMSQQKDDEAMRWLVNLASNSSEPIDMRKKALFWAGQNSGSTSMLTSMYDRLHEAPMKEHMIFVLSQRHDNGAIDKLISIARNDPDREMRRKAMFWLGQSHDPRVSAFLADIINR